MHYANICSQKPQNCGHYTDPIRKGDSDSTEYVYSVSSPTFRMSSIPYNDMNQPMFRPRDLSCLLGTAIIYTA